MTNEFVFLFCKVQPRQNSNCSSKMVESDSDKEETMEKYSRQSAAMRKVCVGRL